MCHSSQYYPVSQNMFSRDGYHQQRIPSRVFIMIVSWRNRSNMKCSRVKLSSSHAFPPDRIFLLNSTFAVKEEFFSHAYHNTQSNLNPIPNSLRRRSLKNPKDTFAISVYGLNFGARRRRLGLFIFGSSNSERETLQLHWGCVLKSCCAFSEG